MKTAGRPIVWIYLTVMLLSFNVLIGQNDSLEYQEGGYESVSQWLMQAKDIDEFYERLRQIQQVDDSLDQIEIARYDSIYRAERDSLGYCDPAMEQFYDGFLSLDAIWIDSISHSCLLVQFTPRFLPPTPYILTVAKDKYDPDRRHHYWDNVYDNKRYTGVFVVCFDKCMTDTKEVLIKAFIPYTDYIAYIILE